MMSRSRTPTSTRSAKSRRFANSSADDAPGRTRAEFFAANPPLTAQ